MSIPLKWVVLDLYTMGVGSERGPVWSSFLLALFFRSTVLLGRLVLEKYF